MRSYIVALFTNYLGLVLTMGIQVFLLPFLLKRIGPELTGLYYLFITVSNFVAVGVGWLTGAGVFLMASADAKAKKVDLQEIHWAVFLGYGLYATLVLGLILLFGSMTGDWWLADGSPTAVAQGRAGCFLLAFYVWFHYLHQADITLLTATLQQGWVSFYRIVSQLIFIGGVVVFVLPAPRLEFLMLANLIGIATVAVAARIHLRISGRLDPLRWRLPDRRLIRELFVSRGGPYFFFGVARQCLIYVDVLLVGALLGPAMVSAYLVIFKIPEVFALLLGRVSEILSPYLTRIHGKDGVEPTAAVYLCTSRLQHCIGILAGFAYGLWGPTMVDYWVGVGVRPQQRWAYWMAGALVALQVVNLHDMMLHYAIARLKRLVIIQFVELGSRVVLLLLLLKSLGIMAPIAGALLVQVSAITWLYRYSALGQLCVAWSDWFLQVAIWPALVLLVVGAGTYAFLPTVAPVGIYNFMVSVLFFGAASLGALVLMERLQSTRGVFQVYRCISKA